MPMLSGPGPPKPEGSHPIRADESSFTLVCETEIRKSALTIPSGRCNNLWAG